MNLLISQYRKTDHILVIEGVANTMEFIYFQKMAQIKNIDSKCFKYI